jgi:hypothetical protein
MSCLVLDKRWRMDDFELLLIGFCMGIAATIFCLVIAGAL